MTISSSLIAGTTCGKQPSECLSLEKVSIAILIPSYNEALSIGQVIADFREALPLADIFVYDNNSSDETREQAETMGAIVRQECRQGKGYVIRRMFADIDSDIYILVDGDGTYDSKISQALVEVLISNGLDMINCARIPMTTSAYRSGHQYGNKFLTGIVKHIFGKGFQDLLSGYRVLSRRFVKSFPITATGFEIETELTIHALGLEMPVMEIPCNFQNRQAGSESKLRTFIDGFRILFMITTLLRQEKPLIVFSLASITLFTTSIVFGYPIMETYHKTGRFTNFFSGFLTITLYFSAFLCMACGLVLDTITRGRQEVKRLEYLSIPGILEIGKKS